MLFLQTKRMKLLQYCSSNTDKMALPYDKRVAIEFQPIADQAWQFWANNELSQSATWCSIFAKVHKADLIRMGGSPGEGSGEWKVPFAASRRKICPNSILCVINGNN